MRFLTVFLFFVTWQNALAQNPVLDSLIQQLNHSQSDEERVMILCDLSYEYLGADMDSALLLAQQAYDLAQKTNFTRGEARALFHLGHTYRILSDIPNSMRASLLGVQLAEENGFRQEAALCNYNTGALYLDLLNDIPQALSYLRRAEQWNAPIQGAIGESCQLSIYINLGVAYEQLDMPDSSAYYYNEAMKHTAIAPNMRLVVLNFKGLLQLKLKNYQEALTFLRQASAKKINHRSSAEIYFNMASCFREMGQKDSCIFYAKNSLAEAEQLGYQQYKMKSATLLAELYEAENNPEALRFFKIAKLASDDVFGEQKVQELQRIITDEMQRQQDAESEKTAYENRVRQLTLLGGLGVVLLVAFLLYRNNRQKQKSNAQLQAQNRELEIETALERVRAKTMAMHKTDELRSVIAAVFEQVQTLGFDTTACGLTLFDKEDKSMVLWLAGFETDSYPVSYHVPYFDHPLYNAQFEAWEKGQTYQLFKFEGELKRSYDELIFELGDFKHLPSSASEAILSIETATNCTAFMKYGMLESVMVGDEVLTEEQAGTLQRFAKVFEQTYTRFLDLQRAEAQAREAQIEAALERVRSRATAMRHSDELSNAAELLYQEFLKFGMISFSCGYLINDDEKGAWKIWLTNPGEAFFKEYWTIPYDADDNLWERCNSWKRGEDFHCAVLEGEANRAHHLVISEYAPWKAEMLDNLPSQLVFNSAHFSLGHLLVISPEKISAELERVMVRFAKVFDLAYRRFLDLQVAEKHTREMAQQASLDRIRAEIASMRTAQDLEQITPLIWWELQSLKVPFIRCGVFIMNEAEKIIHNYLSSPDGAAIAAFSLPYQTPGAINRILENWQSGKSFIDFWDQQAMVEFADTLVTQEIFSDRQQYLKNLPSQGFYLHFVPFKQGMLYVGSLHQLNTEEMHLLHALASSFSTAYARYEDFYQLESAKKQVENTLTELKQAQTQLIQAEKMASLGELTAGIAHEIQNPLNFVNNFSEVNKELSIELLQELEKGNYTDAKAIAIDIKDNEEKIHHHGKRADGIVKNMLQHSQKSSGQKELTDINGLCDEYLRLAYHGLRAKDKNFNAKLETQLDPVLPKLNVMVQDMGRVLLNLINNAFYAVSEKQKIQNERHDFMYEPTVSVSTKNQADKIEISVKDNGNGIPDTIKEKIFQPFFTTKPTGQGTGLGLSLSYDIVKAHGGELKVETNERYGSVFIILLPLV